MKAGRAHELAERGVALDGTSAIVVMRLGWIQTFLRHYDQAVANLEKAIALAPDNAEIYSQFGQVLNFLGNPEKGLQMIEKAFSIETFVPPNWEMHAAHSHLLLRHYDEVCRPSDVSSIFCDFAINGGFHGHDEISDHQRRAGDGSHATIGTDVTVVCAVPVSSTWQITADCRFHVSL